VDDRCVAPLVEGVAACLRQVAARIRRMVQIDFAA
jgi:hypothetical protein